MKKGLIKIWPSPRGAIRQQDLLLEMAKFVESSGRSWVNHKQCNRETIRSTNFDSLSFSSSLLVCTRTLKGLSDKRLSRSYAYPRPRLPRRPVNCISIRIPEVGSPISMLDHCAPRWTFIRVERPFRSRLIERASWRKYGKVVQPFQNNKKFSQVICAA